jgi:hypothetical protein
MVFATHFRRPLPRWADEGGATSMECPSEKAKHRTMLLQFLRTGRGIAFSDMFAMTEYPPDMMPLYAQGYSLAEYLIQHGGRRKYVQFLDDAMASNQWSAAVQRHYGITDLAALQNTWLGWVRDGFPAPRPATAVAGAAAKAPVSEARRPRPEPNLVYRVPNKAEVTASGWHSAAAPPQTVGAPQDSAPPASNRP